MGHRQQAAVLLLAACVSIVVAHPIEGANLVGDGDDTPDGLGQENTELVDVRSGVSPQNTDKANAVVAGLVSDYEHELRRAEEGNCQDADSDACADFKGLLPRFRASRKSCDASEFTKYLTSLQQHQCGGDSDKDKKKRCSTLKMLQVKLPTTVCDQPQAEGATSSDSHSATGTYKIGMPHLFNLTPEQKAYQASLQDVASNYCKRKDPFCKQAKALFKMFTSALEMQYSEPYEKHLKTLLATFCSTKVEQNTKRCKVMKVLSKTMVSVGHMGPTAEKRLTALQHNYMLQTYHVQARYCSEDENSIFCQVCRGLEHEYKESLKQKTNIQYERYLSTIEKQVCGSNEAVQRTPERCRVFPNLRKAMPISFTTLKTLPDKHLEFVNTVSDVSAHLCNGNKDTSLFCELARGIKRVYIQSLNSESNAEFDFYLERIQEGFCTMPRPDNIKACKLVPVLKSGVPPPFLAEGVKRNIDSTNARVRITAAQKQLQNQLKQDRAEYLKSLKDINSHYCPPSDVAHPSYFCMLVKGLVKNYEYSLDTSFENWEYKHYLEHIKRDFCIRGAEDGYDKRCSFLPMLENGLPLSIRDEKQLLHEQSEYLGTMQDIVGHFCNKMTKSVFCQLSHGLVRQFIRAVVDHSNDQFLTYLNNMESHYCGASGKASNTKKCKIFPILRSGIPASGLGTRVALNSAANSVVKAKASLQAAKRIRAIAQEAVKKNPTKESLAALEKATHSELQAEQAVRDAVATEIHKLAENAGAPSTAAVKEAQSRAQQLADTVVKAKEASAQAKYRTTQIVTKAKAAVLETTMKLASATDAVKKNTSAKNIELVQTAMKASAAAKEALRTSNTQASATVQQAQNTVTKATEEAIRAREHAIKIKDIQKKIFTQFALRQAQKSADSAEEASMMAKENAKQASQKLWWAKLYVKENPTSQNKEALQVATHEADKYSTIAERVASNALMLNNDAEEAADKMQLVDGGAAVQDKTETAHLAVQNAEQEASRAQKEAGDVAARMSGPVAEKLIIESKGKATKACSDAKRKEEAMHKAKVALDAAAAEVKKSTSHENLQTIQSAHDKYQDAQRSSTIASSLCEQAQTFANKLTAGRTVDPSDKSKSSVSAASVVQATEAAARASAAVQHAKEEERQAIQEHMSRLKHKYTIAMDEAQLAEEKVSRAESVVARLTDMVAHHPSEQNIASLKKALVDRKAAIQKKKLAQGVAKQAFDVQKAALSKAAHTTTSRTLKKNLSARLHEENLAGVSIIKQKLAAAISAQKRADTVQKANANAENIKAAKAAAENVKRLRDHLAATVDSAASTGKMLDRPYKSVNDIKAAIVAAEKKKEAAKQMAMAHPTNENLDMFRAEVRSVHNLQSELIIAHKQKITMSERNSLTQMPSADDKDIDALLNSYCSTDKSQNICKFYQVYQQDGWKDEEGKMSKHLLSKVAESQKHLEDVKQKMNAAQASATAKPTKENEDQVKVLSKQFVTATKVHDKTQRMVKQFMDHQTQLGHQMKQKTKSSRIELVQQIGRLIKFYCNHHKYAKLCSFYKSLEQKHTADIISP